MSVQSSFSDKMDTVISSSAEEAVELTTGVATGRYGIKEIANWLRRHSRPV